MPGVGISEILAVTAGSALGWVIFKAWAALGLPLRAQVVGEGLPPGIAWMIIKGGKNSLWNRWRYARAFMTRPKRLYFRTGTGRHAAAAAPSTPAETALEAIRQHEAFNSLQYPAQISASPGPWTWTPTSAAWNSD